MMVPYVIVHCTHDGCYDIKCIEDYENNMRITPVTINHPKVFFFPDKDQASDFFNDYINDVDVIDERCKVGDEIDHKDFCTCGIIELDDDGNTILFYNRRNQIFLLENSAQLFLPSDSLKKDIHNNNLTNKLFRTCKFLSREQKKRYIELGKMCETHMKKADEVIVQQEKVDQVENKTELIFEEKNETIPPPEKKKKPATKSAAKASKKKSPTNDPSP